jgi:hypothetical protein
LNYFDLILNINSKANEPINYRLPTNLKPTLYELTIKPYIGENYNDKSFTFEGYVNISFICLNQTNKIILHAKDLFIRSTKLYEINNSYFSGISYNEILIDNNLYYDDIREFIIINLNKDCVNGNNYVISINYTGVISNSLAGFYRSSYLDSNKTKH